MIVIQQHYNISSDEKLYTASETPKQGRQGGGGYPFFCNTKIPRILKIMTKRSEEYYQLRFTVIVPSKRDIRRGSG